MDNLPPSESRSRLKQCSSSCSSEYSSNIGRELTHVVSVTSTVDWIQLNLNTVERQS